MSLLRRIAVQMVNYHERDEKGRYAHFWSAVCDEKGNQIGSMAQCDLCGKQKGK